jgi:hypothetical protein
MMMGEISSPSKKRVKKLSSFEGCTEKRSLLDSRSKRIVRNKHCSVDGCAHDALKSGVCWKHGTKESVVLKLCKVEGCTNGAVKKGVCWRHGTK